VFAFGGHARDNPRETTRWARWAEERHVELGLPPNPRLGIQLGHGLVFDGHLAEGGTAFREAIDIATSIGPDADVDRFEALYALAYTNAMLGAPDLPGAEETLALATRLGSVWLLSRAKGAMGVTLATIDARRATAALDEALELARRADPPYWTGTTRVFAAAARADPYEAIRELACSLDDFRAAGVQQWVRRSLRDFLVHFGAVGRPETVAFIDGCAAPVSTRPDEGRAAVRAARQQLGAARYEEARARGVQVSDAELSGVLRSEIADLFAEERTV
jgi:hypothetical protein